MICEQGEMEKPSPRQLVEAVGISRSYAHELLNGREPSNKVAAKIFKATGLKLGLLATLSDADAGKVAARIHGEQ
jgi:transcriptional regulator with XRE-family HTH domain